MTFRKRLKYIIVQTLKVSNKEAEQLILKADILVNGNVSEANYIVLHEDEILYNGNIIKPSFFYTYIAYNKPVGVESTLNTEIQDNLVAALNIKERLFPLGRLDKASEGLMILTNDGSVFNKTIHSDQEKEKEYIVTVDKKLNDDFLNCLRNGILIMGQITKPAQVFQESSHVFRIVLKQGLNRQIRRMCYKFDYEVLTLKRIRIVNIVLGDLEIGAWRNLTAQEIENLKNI